MNRQAKRMAQRQGTAGPGLSPGVPTREDDADEGRPRMQAPGSPPPEGESIPERSIEYLREVRSELQKVAWPGRAEVTNYTIVVLITVVLLTAFVYGLDYFFAKGIILLFPHK